MEGRERQEEQLPARTTRENGIRYYNGRWPQKPADHAELRALCEYLTEHDLGQWFWNGYSGIAASVPKGHPMDDAFEDEPGNAWVLHINQTPEHEGRGDELHHHLPRHVAAFVEKMDPAFVQSLLDALEAAERRVSELHEALTGIAETVRMYRTSRHPDEGAATMTDAEAAMYRAMHHARSVLDATHPDEEASGR